MSQGEWDSDSSLEEENIQNSNIEGVKVFGKIPGRSIRVLLFFGGSTSLDFMYVLKKATGDERNLIVETKDLQKQSGLRGIEKLRIGAAKKFCRPAKRGAKSKLYGAVKAG